MNDELSGDGLLAPCARWAPLLATHSIDLGSAERDALDGHVSTCRACAAVRAEYQRLDALILGLPAPVPLSGLPPRLLHEWDQEDAQRMALPVASPQTRDTGTLTDDHVALNGHVRGERLFAVHPTSTSPHVPFSSRRRRFAGGLGAAVAAIVVVAFTLVFLAQSRGNPGPGNGPQHGATSSAVTGWQAAYLASDGHLHTITLDGAHDITGPLLPTTDFIRQTDAGWVDAAAAPDGHAIAYVTAPATTPVSTPGSSAQTNNSVIGGSGIAIVTVATGALVRASVPATNIFWSPDSSRLVADAYVNNGMGPAYLINPTTGAVTTIHATLNGRQANVYRIVGWLDSTHLAVLSDRGTSGTVLSDRGAGGAALAMPVPANRSTYTTPLSELLSGGPALAVDVLDADTGALRHLVDVMSPPDVFVSPDGKAIFVAPSTWVSTGYVVNPTTGQTHDLPQISRIFAHMFVDIDNAGFGKGGNWAAMWSWRPGTHTVTLSLGAWGLGVESQSSGYGPAHQVAGVWLLDLDHDTATAVTHNSYPLAWTADGQSLLLADLPPSNLLLGGLSVGPTLSTLSPVAAHGTVTSLAHHMLVFFGLVRTS
jgi:hypothetical protein